MEAGSDLRAALAGSGKDVATSVETHRRDRQRERSAWQRALGCCSRDRPHV